MGFWYLSHSSELSQSSQAKGSKSTSFFTQERSGLQEPLAGEDGAQPRLHNLARALAAPKRKLIPKLRLLAQLDIIMSILGGFCIYVIDRGSYMSAHVLLNLLNTLRKGI